MSDFTMLGVDRLPLSGDEDELELEPELVLPNDLGTRVEWAVRSEEAVKYAPGQVSNLVRLLTRHVDPPAVAGVLRMLARGVNKTLAVNAEVRASWAAYKPLTGCANRNGGYVDRSKVVRIGKVDNYRLVARKPITKRDFLGLYVGRTYWSTFEAEDLDGSKHDACLTLEWYNCTIPLETWLMGKRVVDAGVRGRGRSCWMACGNTADVDATMLATEEAKAAADNNAMFDKDGRCYALRDIRKGEEIRFFYHLHEDYGYQPPVPREENLRVLESALAAKTQAQRERRANKRKGGGGAVKPKKAAVEQQATPVVARVPAIACVVPTGDAAAATAADQQTNEL